MSSQARAAAGSIVDADALRLRPVRELPQGADPPRAARASTTSACRSTSSPANRGTAEYRALEPRRPHARARARGRRGDPESTRSCSTSRRARPLPADPVERAHVHRWLFFEQNLLEPNVGTARFWRLTGATRQRTRRSSGVSGRGGARSGPRRTSADRVPRRPALRGRGHRALRVHAVAARGRNRHVRLPGGARMARRVEATPGFVNDLEPYPPNAHISARPAGPSAPSPRFGPCGEIRTQGIPDSADSRTRPTGSAPGARELRAANRVSTLRSVLGEVLTAIVTPFRPDGSVDFHRFAALAHYWSITAPTGSSSQARPASRRRSPTTSASS